MADAPVSLVTPDYWDEACRHLVRRDRVLKKLIPQFGEARLQSRGDAFTTLARSIVGQQISVKAAQAVWERFVHLLPPGQRHGPTDVLAVDSTAMRAAGLSARKVDYLRDLAQHFVQGEVHETDWAAMGDESIIEELVPSAASAAGRRRCSSSST
jgi:DNA-3-methyladenine glycosylase II